MGDIINMKTKEPEDTEPLPKIPRARLNATDFLGFAVLLFLVSLSVTWIYAIFA